MLNPDNDTLEWVAQWVLDSLKAETNERTIEFGKNMAMTIRAVKTKNTRVPVAVAEVDAMDKQKLAMWDSLVHGVIKASIKLPMAKHNEEVNAELNRLQKKAMEVDPETVKELRRRTYL